MLAVTYGYLGYLIDLKKVFCWFVCDCFPNKRAKATVIDCPGIPSVCHWYCVLAGREPFDVKTGNLSRGHGISLVPGFKGSGTGSQHHKNKSSTLKEGARLPIKIGQTALNKGAVGI